MKTWYRSTSTKKVAGICGGISEMYDIDVTLVRFACVCLLLTPFPMVFFYMVAWAIVPKQGEVHDTRNDISHNTASHPTDNSIDKKEFLVE